MGTAVAVVAAFVEPSVLAGAVAVATLSVAHVIWVRRPPVPAKVLGVRQLLLGLTVVGITAAGVHTW